MTTLHVSREQVKTVLVGRIEAGDELATTQAEIAERAGGWRDWLYLFSTWREHTIAELKAVYGGDEEPREFDVVTQTVDRSSSRFSSPNARSALNMGLFTLRSLVERLPLAVEPEPLQARPANDQTLRKDAASPSGQKVFLVHGRAGGGFREAAARFIEQLGLSVVILAEQANEGRTFIEKFEANTLDVGYAIVLLTPEDRAYGPGDEPPPRPNRPRQNVILELGCFMAKLGRKNVVALLQEGAELPTDMLGTVYIPLDDGGVWKSLVARELRAAGYDLGLPVEAAGAARRQSPARVAPEGVEAHQPRLRGLSFSGVGSSGPGGGDIGRRHREVIAERFANKTARDV